MVGKAGERAEGQEDKAGRREGQGTGGNKAGKAGEWTRQGKQEGKGGEVALRTLGAGRHKVTSSSSCGGGRRRAGAVWCGVGNTHLQAGVA